MDQLTPLSATVADLQTRVTALEAPKVSLLPSVIERVAAVENRVTSLEEKPGGAASELQQLASSLELEKRVAALEAKAGNTPHA